MKLIGRLPRWTGGDEVEVNLLLLPNAIIWLLVMLSPYWERAWAFKALWQALLWHFGGPPPYCQ